MNSRSFLKKLDLKVISIDLVDIPGPQLKVISFLLDLSRNPIFTAADFLGLYKLVKVSKYLDITSKFPFLGSQK